MSLDWPDRFERTPAAEREPYPHGFEVSRTAAFRSLWEELRRLDVRNPRIETAAPHTQEEPWRPYSDRDPDDPAVVARWEDDDGQGFAAPCDRWDNLRDNARAIAKYLDAKRGIDRWGVATVAGEFSTAALPSGEAAEPADPPPHEVLGVAPDAPEAVVEGAARARIKEAHPDQGGSGEELQRVKRARDRLLEEDQS
jgi:hypothetical protein